MPEQQDSLFTVIMAYRGATYVTQVEAADVLAALRKWAEELDTGPIVGLSSKGKLQIIRSIESDIANGCLPTPVEGASNMWCASGSCRSGFMLIDLIKTAR